MNLDGVLGPDFLDVIRWKLGFGSEGRVKEEKKHEEPSGQVLPKITSSEILMPKNLACTWIGHSTFLLEVGGNNLLTDPIFNDSCFPAPINAFRRLAPPGISIRDFPDIHAILISHSHYDHLDIASLKKIGRGVPIYCPMGVARLLIRNGFDCVNEMTWGDVAEVGGDLRLTCLPAQHGSARTPFDRNQTLWCSWWIEGGGSRVYFLGDTGYFKFPREYSSEIGPVDLALIPIGAYKPRWFMRSIHMNPAEAAQMHLDLQARLSVGMHYDTFPLAEELPGEAPVLLYKALEELGIEAKCFLLPPPGVRLNSSV